MLSSTLTNLGGSKGGSGTSIAADRAGNAYITGQTTSTDFPTKNSFQAALSGGYSDAFVTKLNADGSALVYSTYLGGSSLDFGTGIVVGRAGDAYITGSTNSTDFPTLNPFLDTKSRGQDVFVTKLNADGSALVYSTYLGGSGSDSSTGIAVDRADNACITGSTNSTDFPTKNSFQGAYKGRSTYGRNAFVAKLIS